MKLFIMSVALLTASGTAMAIDDFRNDGQIGGYANLDFTMQGETHDAINYSMRKADAGTSAAVALSSIPEASAANTQAVGVGISSYNSGRALSIGYSKNAGRMGYKAGLAYTSEDDVAVGAGLSYAF